MTAVMKTAGKLSQATAASPPESVTLFQKNFACFKS